MTKVKFEAPPEMKQPTTAVRITRDTHEQLKFMAKHHNTSLTKFVAALASAHYKTMKGKDDGEDSRV